MAKVPYVHSNYERVEGDFYPTIDKRCIYGLLEHVVPDGLCVDVCAPDGSGIVDTLKECGYKAAGLPDAFADNIDLDKFMPAQWVITNPPYDRKIVDKIIYRQIQRVDQKEIFGVACLLRSNFSHAKSRVDMFRDCEWYLGEIKLLFRPYWSEDRKASPIHNYVWHLWSRAPFIRPVQFYSLGEKPREVVGLIGPDAEMRKK